MIIYDSFATIEKYRADSFFLFFKKRMLMNAILYIIVHYDDEHVPESCKLYKQKQQLDKLICVTFVISRKIMTH